MIVTYPVIIDEVCYGRPNTSHEADALYHRVQQLLIGVATAETPALAACYQAQLDALEATAEAEVDPPTHCGLCGFALEGDAPTLAHDPEDGGLTWACAACMHLPIAYAEHEAAESDEADVWYALADETADAIERQREDLLDRLTPARELALHGACSIQRCGSRLTLGDGSIWEEVNGRVLIVAPPTSLAAALATARAAALWGEA